MEVGGGAGGTSADLEAMSTTATALAACARELAELALRLGMVSGEVDLLRTAVLDPRGWAEAQAALAVASAGPRGLLASSARTGALGLAVDAAARAYAATDRSVTAVIAETRDAAAGAAGELLFKGAVRYPVAVLPTVLVAAQAVVLWRTGDLVVAAAADAASDAWAGTLRVDSLDDRMAVLTVRMGWRLRDDVEAAGTASLGWLAAHPAAAEHAAAATPSFLSGLSGLTATGKGPGPTGRSFVPTGQASSFPPQDVDDLAALAALVGYGTGLLGRQPVTVRPARVAPPPAARPPAGVAELVARTVALAPARDGSVRGEGGRVRVERVRSGTGRATVVYVPPTQTWELGHGTNPMDATSNIDAMAGLDSAARSGVVQALRAAGVAADEPLLLVGYSQGGLTSMALASDAEFAREFSPTAVLTVGSPVAGFAPPDDVAVLSIEHAEDLVTVVDGAANPDRPSWTTVRREVLDPVDGDPAVRAAVADHPFAPHDPDPYVRTAQRVDESGHPSVTTWRERAAAFLDGPGATSSSTDWVAERQLPQRGAP